MVIPIVDVDGAVVVGTAVDDEDAAVDVVDDDWCGRYLVVLFV